MTTDPTRPFGRVLTALRGVRRPASDTRVHVDAAAMSQLQPAALAVLRTEVEALGGTVQTTRDGADATA